MSAKTESFICQQLPILLQNIEKNHAEQAQRITELNAEQDTFIQGFLASNRYFYASPTENFFYYDGTNYANVTEDEIIHNVLSSISRDRSLMSWKYKTKSAIMKRIKENAIFTCIPESATIQSVLNSLYPATFATKAEAKYFLTVLGDNMLKKPMDGGYASERSVGSFGPLDMYTVRCAYCVLQMQQQMLFNLMVSMYCVWRAIIQTGIRVRIIIW